MDKRENRCVFALNNHFHCRDSRGVIKKLAKEILSLLTFLALYSIE